jgi:hypothetical protein
MSYSFYPAKDSEWYEAFQSLDAKLAEPDLLPDQRALITDTLGGAHT